MKSAKKLLRTIGIFVMSIWFAVGSQFAPAVFAKKTARLWSGVPKSRGRGMDNRVEPGKTMQIPFSIPGGTTQLKVEVWGADDAPIVYLVHGWGGWHGQLGAFTPSLLERGFRVIGFDGASHGYSEPGEYGKRCATVPELRRSFQAVIAHFGQPYGVVAHSLGCALTSAAMLEGLTVTRLALIAPSPDIAIYLMGLGSRLHLSKSAMKQLRPALAQYAREDLDLSNTISLAAQLAEKYGNDLPAPLVVHDRLDKEVRFKTAEAITANWPSAQLMTTQGLGHHRILLDPLVVQRTVNHIVAKTASTY